MLCMKNKYKPAFTWFGILPWAGQNNGNIKKLGNKICVGYTERTSVGNIECSSTVCLQSVVLV
jgi:hypothetical protein